MHERRRPAAERGAGASAEHRRHRANVPAVYDCANGEGVPNDTPPKSSSNPRFHHLPTETERLRLRCADQSVLLPRQSNGGAVLLHPVPAPNPLSPTPSAPSQG